MINNEFAALFLPKQEDDCETSQIGGLSFLALPMTPFAVSAGEIIQISSISLASSAPLYFRAMKWSYLQVGE